MNSEENPSVLCLPSEYEYRHVLYDLQAFKSSELAAEDGNDSQRNFDCEMNYPALEEDWHLVPVPC